jgi:hypothetical protein
VGLWRSRTNKEFFSIYRDCNIVDFLKSQRIRWLGHLARMEASRVTRRIHEGRLTSQIPIGRPRKRWFVSVEADQRNLGVESWRALAANRDEWKKVVASAKIPQGYSAR